MKATTVWIVVLLACLVLSTELSAAKKSQKPMRKPSGNKGASSRVSVSDSKCVICQFIVQRVRGEMLMTGLNGGVPYGLSPALVGLPQAPPNVSPTGAPQGPAAQGPAAGGAPGPAEAPQAGPSFIEEKDEDRKSASGFSSSSLLQDKEELRTSKGFFDNSRGISRSTRGRLAHMRMGPDMWRLRRERNLDMLVYRPQQVRYQNLYDGPLRAQKRAQERFENNQMYASVYETVEDICTKRMPKLYYGYCGVMLARYQKIAQGIRWRDRPDAICMALKMCGLKSYIRKGPHASFRDY